MLKGRFDQTGDIAIDLSAMSTGDIKEPVRAAACSPAPIPPCTVEELIVEAWEMTRAGCEAALYVTTDRTIDDRINADPNQSALPGKRPHQDQDEWRSRPGAVPGTGVVVHRPQRPYPPTAAPIFTPEIDSTMERTLTSEL